MTKEEIFNAIKDEDEVDIWVDDGDKMMSGKPSMDMAEWMLDNIEAGCRVEARIYYDEDGDIVPPNEYDGSCEVDTIFDSDNEISAETKGKVFVKLNKSHMQRLEDLGQVPIYNAVKNQYGDTNCYVNDFGELVYKGKEFISVHMLRKNGIPYECGFTHFDVNTEKFIHRSEEFNVKSIEEVIDLFLDEIADD